MAMTHTISDRTAGNAQVAQFTIIQIFKPTDVPVLAQFSGQLQKGSANRPAKGSGLRFGIRTVHCSSFLQKQESRIRAALQRFNGFRGVGGVIVVK